MKEIPLTQEKVALVSDKDLDDLDAISWRFYKGIAVRSNRKGQRPLQIAMHRVIAERMLDTPLAKEHIVSHVDGNRLNNQRENLRIGTRQQIGGRQSGHRGSRSQYKGVAWHKNRETWVAQIRYEGQLKHIGCFNLEEDAARAYDAKARELFGEFVSLNFPDE